MEWPVDCLGVAFSLTLGMLTFAAIGFLLGVAMPTARAAQSVGMLLWFLMMMVSGAGPPPEVLSRTLRGIATATPLKHVIVALQDPWLGRGVNWTETLILVGILLVASALAVPALRRRTRRWLPEFDVGDSALPVGERTVGQFPADLGPGGHADPTQDSEITNVSAPRGINRRRADQAGAGGR